MQITFDVWLGKSNVIEQYFSHVLSGKFKGDLYYPARRCRKGNTMAPMSKLFDKREEGGK